MNAADIFPWTCAIAAVAGLLWCAVDRDRWKRRADDESERADKSAEEAHEADQESLALASALQSVTAERDEAQKYAITEEQKRESLLQQIERHKGETRAAKAELDAARMAGAETLSKLHVANGKILDLEARIVRVVAEGDRLHDLANSLQSRVVELEADLDRQTANVAHVAAQRDKVEAERDQERRDLNATIERWREDCKKYQALYWQVRDAMAAERQRAASDTKAVS